MRRRGLILAGIAGLAAIGVIAWVVQRADSSPNPSGDLAIERPPDIRHVPTSSGSQIAGLAGAGKLFLQVVDPHDTARVQAEVTADGSEPLPGRRIRMERPRAWIYLKDGRSVHLEADRGEAVVPEAGSGGRPEDTLLEGSVVVRMFPRFNGALRPSSLDSPEAILRTTTARLDAQRGELEIPGQLSVAFGRLEVDGRDAVLLFDEVRRVVESFRIAEVTLCRINPATPKEKSSSQTASRPATPSESPSASPTIPEPSPAAPVETLYHAVFAHGMTIRQGARSVQGGRGEAWMRTLDNTLPKMDGVRTTGLHSPSGRTATTPRGETPRSSESAPSETDEVKTGRTPEGFDNNTPIFVSWDGPLEIRPVVSVPELARDDLHVRLTGSEGGRVVFTDPTSNSHGESDRVDYAVTRKELLLAGVKQFAWMERADAGRAEGQNFVIGLTTGMVRIPGPGRVSGSGPRDALTPGDAGPDALSALAWNTEAEFQFALDNGAMTGLLRQARLSGGVNGIDRGATLRANAVTAIFDISRSASDLRQVHAVGAVEARDADGGLVQGDVLRAEFVAGAHSASEVRRVVVSGSARAEQDGSRLEADEMEADLTSVDGEVRADRLIARGRARFEGKNGERASGPEILARPSTQIVELSGEGSTIGRDGSRVNALRITLDGMERTLRVDGPGEIIHHAEAVEGRSESDAHVSWTDGLTFDDLAGVGQCVGSARAELTRGDLERDTLSADLILVEVEQKEVSAPTSPDPSSLGALKALTAIGTGGESPEPAKLEVRRYSGRQPVLVLERLMYLEGARVIADNAAGRLDVPTSGKLLVMDRREVRQAPANTPAPDVSQGYAKGTALFTWQGSMWMQRADGEARMTDEVRLIHDRGDESPRTQLDANMVVANVRERPGSDNAEVQADLVSARAEGNVRLLSGTRTLRGATLSYDAVTGEVDAQSATPGVVEIIDTAGTSPVRAQRVLWNLRTDRVEARAVRPVTAPK